MPELLTDSLGKPIPQYENLTGTSFESVKGRNNAAFASIKGSNTQIGSDLTFTWANSDAAGTVKTATVAAPTVRSMNGKYLVEIVNTSTETPITVKFQNTETNLGGATRYPTVGQVIVAANDSIGAEVTGWFLGDADSRIYVTNNKALSATGGFSVYMRIREINN